MKRIILAVLALVTALSLCSCSRLDSIIEALNQTAVPTEAPTAEPTEEPPVTEAPTETPAVTETPAPAFCEELEHNADLTYDIDFDGTPDTVRIDETTDEYSEYIINITVTRGADPEHPYTYQVNGCFEFSAWMIDCDESDSRLELLFSYGQDSDDWTTVGVRVSGDGSSFDEYEGWFGVTAEAMKEYTLEFGFPVDARTDLLGTRSLLGTMKLDGSGFTLTSDGYLYNVYEDVEYQKLMLKRSMDVELIGENGESLGSFTIPAGERILPYKTDAATYVIVRLEDGRLGRAAFEYHDGENYPDDYGYYINGIDQDEYADIPYAD